MEFGISVSEPNNSNSIKIDSDVNLIPKITVMFKKSTGKTFNLDYLVAEKCKTQYRLAKFQKIVTFLRQQSNDNIFTNLLLNQSEMRR